MTNRVTYTPQDFQKMCKQAERDHEAKKLIVLMERVKRQIAERGVAPQVQSPKPPMTEGGMLQIFSRPAPSER